MFVHAERVNAALLAVEQELDRLMDKERKWRVTSGRGSCTEERTDITCQITGVRPGVDAAE